MQQRGQALAFFDKGAEKSFMTGQAQGIVERLESLLLLLRVVERQRQQNVQLQLAASMLPVMRLLNGIA
ncbi:hypothetical protein D3C81_2300920 [compost metagenome]